MGVTELWPILSELCERKPLTYLTGKCVAVDLSGWVVEAIRCEGLNVSKNPHLRNLFFRVSRLLQLGVSPIFVTEGKPPPLKEIAFKARNQDRYLGFSNNNTIARPMFDETLRECQDLLTCLGVPCIKSSGEAEAFCALLCLEGVVDGVITEDNDAFLYGADVIYRDFSIKENDSHVNVYSLKSEKNKLQLSREKLVALALLLGCDYSKGVPGIGRVAAESLISELRHEDVLQRFKDWKNLSQSELFPGLENAPLKKSAHCKCCGHLGSLIKHKKGGCSSCDSKTTCLLNPDNLCSCEWHIVEGKKQQWKTELKVYNSIKKNCPNFPNEKVIEEYLNFSDSIPDSKDLEWTCPNLAKFQEKALNHFGWTFENSKEKVLPLVTAWQQYKLRSNPSDKTNFIYEPVEILKEHNLRGDTYYDVRWEVIMENDNLNFPTEDVITKEYGDQFDACYKEIVEKFHNIIAERKRKKEAKEKPKKLKANSGNRKVKPKTRLHDVNVSDQQCINLTTISSDSYNGLLDMSLWERINLMTELLIEDDIKLTDSDSAIITNETVNFLLNGSDFSEVVSPVPENLSNISLEVKPGGSLKLAFNGSLNEKGQNTTKPSKVKEDVHHLDMKHSYSFNFSDSDSSFLSLLLCRDQKDAFAANLDQNRKEILIINNSKPSELTINLSMQKNYSRKTKCVESLCSPMRSPRLLYSVNQSTSTPKNNICYNHVFSSLFNSNTTPLFENERLAKDSNFCTPKSSKLRSNSSKLPSNIYSPLMFDSSIHIV